MRAPHIAECKGIPHMTTATKGARLRARGVRRAVALLTSAVMVVTLISFNASAAFAVDENGYPTWEEVEAARGNEAAAQAEVTRIENLLVQLAANLEAANQLAQQRAQEAAAAQEAYDLAVAEADLLQQQADAAQATADDSRRAAALFVAQLARSGGVSDMSAELFVNPGSADDWLYRLGALDRAGSNAEIAYAQAQQDANTAQSLQDQATVARDALDALNVIAQEAFVAAQEAQAAAQAALEEQQANEATLRAQLEVLIENRAATEADYNAGQEYYAELERQRLAEIAAAAAAAAEAAAQAGGGSGWVAPSGGAWTVPTYGYISSGFGWRQWPLGAGSDFHDGLDFANGCWQPVYAAAAGVIAWHGIDSAGGIYLTIDHGSGVSTDYWHLPESSYLPIGTWVAAGQPVAYIGTTGLSTGCHLHFRIRVGGELVNPLTFLRNQGVGI